MNKYLATATLLLGLWTTNAAAASGLPAYYPDAFGNWGIINIVDGVERVLVIDDRAIRFSDDLQVYTLHTQFGTAAALHPGMKVGFGPGGARLSGQTVISEIWILPPDYTPLRGSR